MHFSQLGVLLGFLKFNMPEMITLITSQAQNRKKLQSLVSCDIGHPDLRLGTTEIRDVKRRLVNVLEIQ